MTNTATFTKRQRRAVKKGEIENSSAVLNQQTKDDGEGSSDCIDLIDYIRGDPRLPERYVFDPDLYPDYSRRTQRRLVEHIQEAFKESSPISVHQWANEEHDARVVRRIRFRCAHFRKKKRRMGAPCCLFQFQVCYMPEYGWCLLNGKGQHVHNGHSLSSDRAPFYIRDTENKERRKGNKQDVMSGNTFVPIPPPVCVSPATSVTLSTEKIPGETADQTCYPCTEEGSATTEHAEKSSAEQFSEDKREDGSSVPAEPLTADTTISWVPYPEDEEDLMDLGLFENSAEFNEAPIATLAASDGLLQKTVHLSEIPFPEYDDLDDRCEGLVRALRKYAASHDFIVDKEEYHTVDRPDEKTMRVVLYCVGSGCCYQVPLLWIITPTKWQIHCEPDGIFVHGCRRLEQKNRSTPHLSSPLYQALEHFTDFLDGEVVCPDELDRDSEVYGMATCCYKGPNEKQVSENTRKETRKALAKGVAGTDAIAIASAA